MKLVGTPFGNVTSLGNRKEIMKRRNDFEIERKAGSQAAYMIHMNFNLKKEVGLF
jgi:hypothetical protein